MARKKAPTPALPPPPKPLEPGEVVGTYRILRKLGEGGMGAVYEAEHVHMGSKAAIKVLLPELSTNPDAVTRFVNEARAASSLKHRNIVTVHDCAQRPNGQWFIVLQFVEGGSLKKRMQTTGGPMALGDVVSIASQTASGLHSAHEHEIIHRDIKPENVLLTQSPINPTDDQVTIVDFGIAKLSKARGGSGTRAGTIVGTPNYMAPEHLRGHEIDRRTDVYALGVVVWEMLTGEPLWGDGTDEYTVIIERQATRARPLDPCVVKRHIPAAMGAAVASALAFDPAERWPTVQAFALALAHGLVTDWGETGIEIVRRVANELTIAPPESTDTAGRPVPTPAANAPTVRVVAPTATPLPTPGAVPIVALPAPTLPLATVTPAPAQPGRPDARTIATAAPEARGTLSMSVNVSQSPVTVAEPLRAAQRRRRGLFAAAGAAAVAVVVVGAVVASSGGGSEAAAPPSATPGDTKPVTAATSEIVIITEPAGAAISVDGVPRGVAPVSIAAPVGTEVEVRAELVGHAVVRQGLTVTAKPATVRLTLPPLVDATAVVDAAIPVDASASRRRSRPEVGGFDPDGLIQP